MSQRQIARTRCVPVARLGPADREAMFALMARYYSGVTREAFLRDLDEKQHVIRMLDGEGELAGFSTIQVLHTTYEGRKVVTVFSGDTVIDERCWGQKKLQRTFTAFLLRVRLRYPLRKVYWFLISKGYKTYLLMRNNLLMFPNHQGRTPAGAQAALHHVATLKYPEAYDPQRGVIASCGAAVKDDAADLSPRDLEHPDIRFFCAQNPGWKRGDELCCLADVQLYRLLLSALKYSLIYPLLALFGRGPRRRGARAQAVVGSRDGGTP
ncbi:MAG: hypothetical protein KDD82_04890 [Planctomycetes bacterium]|nr:hypothetical protein [Planctomycetota bacterium]